MTLRVHPDEIIAQSKSPLLAVHDTWERVRIRDICELQNGGAFRSALFNTSGRGIPLIRIRDVGQIESKTYYSGEYRESYLVLPDDLVVGMDGDFRVAVWKGQIALLNQRVCRLRVRNYEQYNQQFLGIVLQGYLDAVHAVTSAVTVKHLSSKTVEKLLVPLPPIAEQERIVGCVEELFTRLDAVEVVLESLLQKLNLVRSAILTDIFHTDGPLPNGWSRVRIGQVCDVIGGATPRTTVSEYWGGNISWITPKDLSTHSGVYIDRGARSLTAAGYDSCSTKLMPAGTVVFTSRAPIGYIAILSQPACTNQGFKSFVPSSGLLSEYLYWYLYHITPLIVSMGSGTTFKELSKRRAADIPLTIASIEDQARIVEHIKTDFSRLDSLEDTLKHGCEQVTTLRKSVLAEAFAGRLVPQDPEGEPASLLLERIAASRPAKRKRRRRARA